MPPPAGASDNTSVPISAHQKLTQELELHAQSDAFAALSTAIHVYAYEWSDNKQPSWKVCLAIAGKYCEVPLTEELMDCNNASCKKIIADLSLSFHGKEDYKAFLLVSINARTIAHKAWTTFIQDPEVVAVQRAKDTDSASPETAGWRSSELTLKRLRHVFDEAESNFRYVLFLTLPSSPSTLG